MELADIFNQFKELIYISDIETYELLFINDAVKKRFKTDMCAGVKCYQFLQGKDRPCEFCTNSRLKKGEFLEWEIHNPLIKRHAILKDTIIEFNGRLARLEIAEDITDVETTNKKLTHSLEAERFTLRCLKSMYSFDNPKDSIAYILKQIGEFFNADRAYIFEIKGPVMNNTFEWCKEGIEPQIDFCQNMETSLIDMWSSYFKEKKGAIIPDISILKDKYPQSYQALYVQGIESIVVSPLIANDKLKGYIGVDNPDLSEKDNFTILDTLTYFFSISMERMHLNEVLKHNSYYDMLTGLYNRNKFMEDTDKRSKEDGPPTGIVYVDVNGLKTLNDLFGHRYGDKVLLECANILKKAFPKASVYRIGGDEFVVLIENITEEKLFVEIEKLKNLFLMTPHCRSAIGYSWSESGSDLQREITMADEYMYKDKMHYYRAHPSSGRYRYYNDGTLKLAREDVLYKALKNGCFTIYLQPKVDFQTNHIIGAEALIRYIGEDGTIVMPDQFIPAIEDARTIYYIDFYVFNRVCALIDTWQKEGFPLVPISVNFSRYTLMLPDFVNHLNAIWNKYSISKNLVEIEIIESVESINSTSLEAIMDKIKQSGFPICIDDFGVKYSNIALFINTDLDVLKLDKSMIHDITVNKKSRLLISSLVQICHNLNIQLIVEGVESVEQFEILKALNCDGAQGFFICRPISIEAYKAFYLSHEQKTSS